MISFKAIENFSSYQTHLGDLETTASVLCTDSRKFEAENAFLAIKGPNFDGYQFAGELASRKTPVIIVEINDQRMEEFVRWSEAKESTLFIGVSDAILFLQELARNHLELWEKMGGGFRFTVGITGSNGKTTHKEMLHALLDSALPGKVYSSRGNLNNHIGVPLTLLELNQKHHIGIIEMGTNHPGEIQVLAELAHPQAGLISNIGQAHLEFFKNLENVFKEKSSLYREVVKNTDGQGPFIVDGEDDFLSQLEECEGLIKLDSRFVSYSDNSFDITDGTHTFKVSNDQIFGSHNFKNLARCCALALKLFPDKCDAIVKAASDFTPPAMNRSNWIKSGSNEIFLDAYNANPSSMKVALESFVSGIGKRGAKLEECFFVLGDMNELGEKTPEFHAEIGQLIEVLGISQVAFVGRYGKHYKKGFASGKLYASTEQLAESWPQLKNSYRYFFLKGSRTLQLESLIDI